MATTPSAHLIALLRESGLQRAELATALKIDYRTLAWWMTGGHMNKDQSRIPHRLRARVLVQVPDATPAERREKLLASNGTSTLLERIAQSILDEHDLTGIEDTVPPDPLRGAREAAANTMRTRR